MDIVATRREVIHRDYRGRTDVEADAKRATRGEADFVIDSDRPDDCATSHGCQPRS